jgi:hypothetical protein
VAAARPAKLVARSTVKTQRKLCIEKVKHAEAQPEQKFDLFGSFHNRLNMFTLH